MPTLALTRRRTQIEVLRRACEKRERVRLVRADRPSGPPAEAFLLALEADGLLVTWPNGGLGDLAMHGSSVHGLFAWEQRTLGFRSQTCGRAWYAPAGGTDVEALKLTLPLRVERREERARRRLALGSLASVPLRCTSVADDRQKWTAELGNVSYGGLSGRARGVSAGAIRRGDVYWTRFELAGVARPLEFVVRIVHARHNLVARETSFGGWFVPGEDPAPHRARLDTIAEFIAGRAAQRAALREGAA